MSVSPERSSRAGERKHGDRYGDGYIHSNLEGDNK